MPPASNDLSRPWLHILLALADCDRHGYGIMLEVQDRSEGSYRLWPATLYGALKRMTAAKLVEPIEAPRLAEDDERRRYYRITDAGRQALSAEVGHLENLVEVARAKLVKLAREA